MRLALGAWSGSRDGGCRDLAFSIFHAPNAPVIQLAMLDTVGGTRGTDMNELGILQGTWKEVSLTLSNASELEAWEKNWSNWRSTACG